MKRSRAPQASESIRSGVWRLAPCFGPFVAIAILTAAPAAAESPPAATPAPSANFAWVVVPTPIDGLVDTRVVQQVDKAVANLAAGESRPILVVEFRGEEGVAATGASQFERSLALARYLASAKLRRVRTVAFAPQGLRGHAVLPALACEELVVGPEAEFGPAGQEDGAPDSGVAASYREIVERRRTFPWPVVLGMLDRETIVSKVELDEGVRYVTEDQRRELEQSASVRSLTTIKPAGELARFSGRDLRLKFGFASHLAADRRSLSIALGLPLRASDGMVADHDAWRALRVELRGPIHARSIAWVLRSLDTRLKESDANLLILTIDSPGGSLSDSLSLAHFLAELDPQSIRTVAYVTGEARGDAALVALACDRLVMAPDAVLGGAGTAEFAPESVADAMENLRALAERKQVAWSPLAAMIDPAVRLRRYDRADVRQTLVLAEDEFSQRADRDRWQAGEPIDSARGIRGADAESLGLAEFLAEDFSGVRRQYPFDGEGTVIEPTWAHLFIERLASPRFAALLLFVAWFAMMVEFMTPSMTGAGFVSAICFLLYFWSQFLHGTAGWLEILLFLAGVTGVFLEIFVFPGVAVFGFGGGALILTSIVLASQTFVIPRNQYQLEQLPSSLGVLIVGVAGAGVALGLLRHLIPRSPLFRRLMLAPPDAGALAERTRREVIADFDHLAGRRGEAVTQLTPAGKVRIDGQVVNVVSDGSVVARGESIEVIEVIGNRVIVRGLGS